MRISNQTALYICFALFFVLFTSAPSTAYACSCVELPSVKEEYERSAAVFAGKVLEVKERQQINGQRTKSVLFDVTTTWKGVSESQVFITTGFDGGDCGYEFKQGKEYIVYASQSSMYGGNALVTTICDRTNEAASAKEDVTILGKGKTPTEQVNLKNSGQDIGVYVWILTLVVVGVIIFIWRRTKRS